MSQWNYSRLAIGIMDGLWRQWKCSENNNITIFARFLLKFLIVLKCFEFILTFSEFNDLTGPRSFSKSCRWVKWQNSRVKDWFQRDLESFKFCFSQFFWSRCHISRFYLLLVAKNSLSKHVRNLMIILNCIIYGLQVNSLKSFSNGYFFVFFCLILLGCQLLRFCLFGWDCSIDLLVRYIRSVFHSILWIVFQDSSCYVFLFRRHDFCYDHMTSQPLFVHSLMQFQLNCMCDVIFRS